MQEQNTPHFKLETRNIFKLSNVCIFLYILLNLFLIWSVLSWFTYTWDALGMSVLVYAVSLAAALSPIGEFLLRLQTGCKRIKREDHKALLMPLFEEVYAKAKATTPGLPDGIKIYLNEDNSPNAFATGRRTICATRGLLKLPPEEIKAILAHEFGHIAHRDTYLLQAVIVGNVIVTVVVTAIRIVALFMTGFARIVAICTPSTDLGVGHTMEIIFTTLAHILVIVGFNVFMWLWNKIGILLCMKTSRGNEFEADRFSHNCGYGRDLISAFERLAECGCDAPKGIFATLASSHPDFDSRIAKLQELGKGDAAAFAASSAE